MPGRMPAGIDRQPRRVSVGFRRSGLAALAALAVTGCAGGPPLVERAASAGSATFDAAGLLALSDTDMAGTAYADGRLHPLAGARDTLSVLSPQMQVIASLPVSNSVMAWPGSMDVSDDGRFALVAELRQPAPAGVDAFGDGGVYTNMPEGRVVSLVDLADPRQARVVRTFDMGAAPTAVEFAPDGRFAIVSLKQPDTPLAVIVLAGPRAGEVVPLRFALAAPATRPIDQGALFVRLAPNGRDFAINTANTHVQFGRLDLDADAVPVAATAVGGGVAVGGWLTMLRWAPDGRHLIVADVGWGTGQLDAVLNGPGRIVSVRVDPGGSHAIASEVPVSLSPEGFELNRAGDLIVAVNMERTYLPEAMPYQLFGRRDRNSLSLVSFDPPTGRLGVIDQAVAFGGVLPEDAVFDADGDMIAVAVFHEKAQAPQAGWVELFRIEGQGAARRVYPTGQKIALPRGVHDLELLALPPEPATAGP